MKQIALLILSFLALLSVEAQTPDAAQTRADFEQIAAKMPYLPITSVIYRREDDLFRVADPHTHDEYIRLLRMATDRKYTKEALLELLVHHDPKVRTLAAVALYDREDPSMLPALVRLSADDEPTFDSHPELSKDWLARTGVGPPPLKQTVADFAKRMVSFYMEPAGYNRGIAQTGFPGFAEYWKTRGDRAYCASWFTVQLQRACGGTSPAPPETIGRIQAVRKRIDALPADERTYVLLWLNSEGMWSLSDRGRDALASQQEVVDACKNLGHDKLMLILENKIAGDDPDLPLRWAAMTVFILQHAGELLRPDDAGTLQELESWQRDYEKHEIRDPLLTPWWDVAVARLKPDQASKILHGAMGRFQEKYMNSYRTILSVAMWETGGKSESDYLTDWFYSETPDRSEAYPHCRSAFIEAMGKEPDGKTMLGRIIKDPRFPQLDWESLAQLVRVINAWSKAPIVTEDELKKAWHPLGPSGFDQAQVEAEKKYPKETAELLAHLSEWRKRVRESVPGWLGDNAASADAGPSR